MRFREWERKRKREKEQKMFDEKTFDASKGPIKFWDVKVDNIVIPKLFKTKTNSKYLVGYSDKTIRPAVLIRLKMSGYVKIFEVKDKKKSLRSFRLDMRSY